MSVRGLALRVRTPHRPEDTVLHRVVREHLATFLDATARGGGRPLPAYVVRAFETYLTCGIAAHGCARVYCEGCRAEAFVAFSCKRRGVCPSCNARRMDETAAHLVDHVLPDVPLRQWVLTFPFAWRVALAGRAVLLGACIRVFDREVQRWLRAPHAGTPRRRHGTRTRDGGGRFADADGRAVEREVQGGAIVATQRYGGSLNLNPHVHLLGLDGVYVSGADGGSRFVVATAPSRAALEGVLARVVQRCTRLLTKAGLFTAPDAAEVDGREPELPAIETCRGIGVQRGTFAGGGGAGGEAPGIEKAFVLRQPSRWGAEANGFTLHAGVTVAAGEAELRERLCRYLVRPAFALGRIEQLDDGRIAYRCKERGRQRWRVMEPVEFLARLAALVPPPRRPELRYTGVLAPNAARRPAVVPTARREATRARRCAERAPKGVPGDARSAVRVDAVPWAELLRRVHGVDALACRRCGGRMRVIALIVDAQVAQRVLRAAGERCAVPTRARARDPTDE